MAETERNLAQRPDIEVYINDNLCGEPWLSFTESPNAQTKSRKFINQKNETSSIVRYATQWAFEVLLDYSKPEVKEIYDIAIEHKTGDDAKITVKIVDKLINKTRTYKATVQVSSIDDDDDMVLKGTVYADGDEITTSTVSETTNSETTA